MTSEATAPSPALAPAPAGTKRRFSMFSSDQAIIQFELEGQRFSIHEALLDHHSKTWRKAWKHTTGLAACKACPHTVVKVSVWGFRGFIHWLYERKIPGTTTLEELKWSSEDTDADKEMFAIDLNTKLYFLGRSLRMEKLQDDTMTWLFDIYRNNDRVPSIDLLRYVGDYLEDTCVDTFFGDLLSKRKAACLQLLKVADEYLPEACANNICESLLEEMLSEEKPKSEALELRDYHLHSESATSCACHRKFMDARYCISK
ncbi:hypothetical protein P171DRAFT_446541 [Karstenula rhodostoma CBS 690.94]|uniref:BTB domain-containing protein n=1 Tax=Karstenula rhodostoma CBS 690.94 TaxID=1392251 RepID=A0A9P4PB05_9PLEO|nr:hypothetical protein P171DRAFT_446541 [Karstenula rhodostoma CBS 690.94]